MNSRTLMMLTPLVTLIGCDNTPSFDVTQQAPRVERRSGSGGYLALEVLATDSLGEAVSCQDGSLDVDVEVAGGDGVFASLSSESYMVVCDDGRTGDLAIVVDNSGSEDGFLPWLQEGSRSMAGEIVDRGGRVSITRVSTASSVEQTLTDNADALDSTIDEMFVANGWTALYDGVRMGNETLGGAVQDATEADRADSLESFCASNRTLGIVAFTDGANNNSADEHDTSYAGDGIDTTFDDLKNLRVGGATTPIYTIGLGRDVVTDELQGLADATGGRYLPIGSAEQLPQVFDVIGDYFDASHEVCVELPEQECGTFTVRIGTTWTYAENTVDGVTEHVVHLPCDADPAGRVATILLTTSDPGIPSDLAGRLTRQTTEWVSPVLRPDVLVVLDDNAHGEDLNNVNIVTSLLNDADNNSVTYLDEPDDGLTRADFNGYDVIWFSNPGYPMDDISTFRALEQFSADGGGVVLQGDDMTRSWGNDFSPAPLVHLDHRNNGTRACGERIDNYEGGKYSVTMADDTHAMTVGIEGLTFDYSNDIDHSTARDEGEVILATATVKGDEDCMEPIPVIVGFEP